MTGFNSYSILVGRDRQSQLVYKRAISAIMPGEPVQMGQSDKQEASQV